MHILFTLQFSLHIPSQTFPFGVGRSDGTSVGVDVSALVLGFGVGGTKTEDSLVGVEVGVLVSGL